MTSARRLDHLLRERDRMRVRLMWLSALLGLISGAGAGYLLKGTP